MFYFAGLFDAEGYVSLGKDGRFHIGTEMSNEEIIKLFQAEFGGHIYYRKRDKRKPTWTWVIATNSQLALDFINKISPFSIIKQSQLFQLKAYLNQTRQEKKETRDNCSHLLSSMKKPFTFTKEEIRNRIEKHPEIDFFQWLAGFFDGDGNFCIYEYQGKKTQIFDSWISIFNIHAEPIIFVNDRIEGSISSYKGAKFPIWKWVCNQKNSKFVCESILPFLRIKRECCILVLEFLKIHETKKRNTVYTFEQINRIREIIKQIKHLNSL